MNCKTLIRRRPKLGIWLLAALILLFDSQLLQAQTGSRKKILILNSFHRNDPDTQAVTKGIESIISPKDLNIDARTEYLDTGRHESCVIFSPFASLFESKYQDILFDAIIVNGNEALNFVLPRRQQLFKTAPIIFCSINRSEEIQIKEEPNITGVFEAINVAGTIRLALKIHPETQHFVIINDGNDTAAQFTKMLLGIDPKLVDNKTYSDLKVSGKKGFINKLQQYPENTVLLYMSYRKDKEGNLLDLEDNLKLINNHCKLPSYTFWNRYVELGAFGGMVSTAHLQGEMAARKTLEILKGRQASEVEPLKDPPTEPVINYDQLVRLGIDKKRLPPGTEISGEPVSFYYRNQAVIYTVTGIILVLLGVVVSLSINTLRRKRAENTLRQVIDLVPHEIFAKNRKGQFILANKATAKFYGTTVEKLVGKSLQDFHYSSEKVAKIIEDDLEVIESGSSKYIPELETSTIYGQKRSVEINKIPYRPFGSNERAVLGIEIDITQRSEAEEALTKSENRFRQMFENNNAIKLLIDPDSGSIVDANQAAARFYGYTLDTLKQMNFKEFDIKSIYKIDSELKQATRSKRSSFTGEHRLASGEIRAVEIHTGPVDIDDETLLYSIVHDIQVRKKAEVALLDSEARFRGMFENSPLPIWEEDFSEIKNYLDNIVVPENTTFANYLNSHPEIIENCKKKMKVLSANQAMVELYEAEDKDSLLKGLQHHFTEGTIKAFRQILIGIKEGKTDFEIDCWTRSLKGSRRDIVLRWSTLPGYKKNLAKVLVSLVDITNRKRQEKMQQGRSQVLEFLAKGAALEKVLKVLANVISEALPNTACAIFLLDEDKWKLNHTVSNRLPKEFINAFEWIDIGPESTQIGKATYTREIMITEDIKKDPDWAPYLSMAENAKIRACIVQPILSASRDAIGTIALFYQYPRTPSAIHKEIMQTASDLASIAIERKRDESKMVLARQAAEAADRSKGEFLAMMSHEIRTPMNGVIGFTSIMMETDLTEEQRDYVMTIQSSGQSLLKLLNDILDFSKIEAGKLELEQEEFYLPGLLNEIASIFSIQAKDKGIKLELEMAENLPELIISDAARTRQILFNLVGNAIKFTDEGFIKIEVNRKMIPPSTNLFLERLKNPVCLEFKVIDTGIGIANESANRLFEMFSQADSSTTRKFGGTGLGLAISKRLSEMLGGNIGFESKLDSGSTFYFTILADFVDNKTLGGRNNLNLENEDLFLGDKYPFDILVTEDDPVNQRMTTAMLNRLGYENPTLTDNGIKCLEALKEKPFDIVILDLHMPELDGLQTTLQIRESKGFQPYIIGLTADVLKTSREDCLNAGMNDYLTKPVTIDELRSAIANAANQLNIAD